jgi:P-type conjugative transfer protein TrbJ
MLENEARNLTNLDYSSLAAITGAQSRIGDLLSQANRIAYDVNAIETTFLQRYGVANLNASDTQLIDNAQERWKDASAAFQDAMTVQAGAVNNLPSIRTETEALVTRSQGAVGILQATQAGNQLLGVQAAQLADLTAVIAADGRARALDEAGKASAEAQAREQYRRFLTDAQGYQPATVQMFH